MRETPDELSGVSLFINHLVTISGAAICEGLPCYRDELPAIAGGIQRQFHNAVGGGIPHLTCE